MDDLEASAALSTLGHPRRLEIFRVLAASEPRGIEAATLAGQLRIPKGPVSVHLKPLIRCGLVRLDQRGKVMAFHAEIDYFRAVVEFGLASLARTPIG